MVKPRQVEPQGPPLSAKGPFVKFDPVVSKISGDNNKKPLDNYIIDFKLEPEQLHKIKTLCYCFDL